MSDKRTAPTDLAEPSTSGTSGPETDPHATESSTLRIVDKRWWARTDSGTTKNIEENSDKPAYVQQLERQVREKEDLIRDYAAKYKGAQKDFEETRVRVRREVTKDVEREKRSVLASFLDVVDNLERALEAGQTESADGALLTGVEMVYKQSLVVLSSYGVNQIESAGQLFDPTLHDAVTAVPVENSAQENMVLTVIKPGYRIGNDILRPASVTVGRSESS